MFSAQWQKALSAAQLYRERGQGLAEYGLIITLIALVCVLAISAIGGSLFDMISTVAAIFQ